MKSPITCHILDTTVGKPAQGVTCGLYHLPNGETTLGECKIALLETDKDGRINNWVMDPALVYEEIGINQDGWQLHKGVYKIRFQTSRYFIKKDSDTFFPFVDIIFVINDVDQHYHIPLLLSNHSYTTYRGS